MQGATDRSRQDLCLKALDSVDIGDLLDQLDAIPAAVVDPSDKRRNISGSCFCSQDRLSGRKYQGTIGLDTIIGKPLDGFYTILDHRHFYNNIRVDCVEFFTFFNDLLEFGRDHFGADIAINYLT